MPALLGLPLPPLAVGATAATVGLRLRGLVDCLPLVP